MIKSIKAILAQDKEKFKVPRKVQDIIPIKNIWPDGIFKVGNKFSKSFRFSDINYLVASREDKESMFLTYSELLNSLDSGATTKITINNHRLNRSDFEESILKGPLTENYVLQQLRGQFEVEPRYYSNKNSEIDFVLQSGTEIIPIEAKGGEDKSAPSFKKYVAEHQPEQAFRFSKRGYRKDGGFANLPLYLARKTRDLL